MPVPPFLVAAEESVQPGPWRLAGDQENLGGRLDHWDSDLTLCLYRGVLVDLDLLRDSSGATGLADMALAVVWRSDRTRLRGAGTPVALDCYEGTVALSVAVDIPGRIAGGSLELQTMVVRTAEAPDATPIVARRAGSVLWRDRVLIALEGDAARFPVTVVDFQSLPGFDPCAAWALEWSPHDLNQPVLGAIRLLVNARSAALVAALGDENDPARVTIGSMVRFDVARSLVHGVLANDEFVSGPREFEPDSVGRMLGDLLDRYWPGADLPGLAGRARTAPHRLDAELQARTGLLAL